MKKLYANRIKELGMPAKAYLRYLTAGLIATLALPLVNCGGGGGSSPSTPVVPQNPSPIISFLAPASAPAGSRALTLTVNGSDFVSGSVIQWGGAARSTVYVNSAQLTTTITPSDLSNAGTAAVTVFSPSPGGGTSGSLNFTIAAVAPVAITTARLPDAYRSKGYDYTLKATGGIPPYSWSITVGNLPGGLTLASGGSITGTPPVVAGDTTFAISVQVGDFAYQANTATRAMNLVVRAAASPGRNDTCGTATPISNGVLRASISPFGDIDVYSFQGTAGNKVTAEIYARRLTDVTVRLDSFLEILNSSCEQINYNDDISLGVIQDSLISDFSLPYTGTYYIRVSDLRGDGRPDLIYELHLSGGD